MMPIGFVGGAPPIYSPRHDHVMASFIPPVFTTLMYQYSGLAQLTSYIYMGKTRPAKKTEYCRCAGAG
jgi:hypothetical protein